MNDAQILTHPAFDRPPVLNAKRHGRTPRGIPCLIRERREREANAWQKAKEANRELTPPTARVWLQGGVPQASLDNVGPGNAPQLLMVALSLCIELAVIANSSLVTQGKLPVRD
jgi:hypothetical protein